MYGWEESDRHDFSHPSLIQIREVSLMVNFVYGINLSCFQVYYETYVLGFISWYVVLICMLRNCVPMAKGIGITIEIQV